MAKLSKRNYKSLGESKEASLARVDQVVEDLREQQTGQQAVYLAKYQDALRVLSGTDSTSWVLKESESVGLSQEITAQRIVEARELWEAQEAVIEAARIQAKLQVRAAQSNAELHEIMTSFAEALASPVK